ncbi:MAG: DUF3800 domain-containing protein [Desulfomonilaceae bacterium]|nr:DUF3800 domain-containing protein [Desulfomonilaceae bacterium]
MYLCYLDESGTTDHTGNTDHFVLLGVAFPDFQWKAVNSSLSLIKSRYGLDDTEIHTGWLARRYQAQQGLTASNRSDLRRQTDEEWKKILVGTHTGATKKKYGEEKKRYDKSKPYFHLDYSERIQLLRDLLDTLNNMQFVRIFAESIDKTSCRSMQPMQIFEQAFLQVVTRFDASLEAMAKLHGSKAHGILIQDNNSTVASRLTKAMTQYHDFGTRYRSIEHIVEPPVFVDSKFTSMVQIADVCAYAFRRFFDHAETDLFDRIYGRIDRKGTIVVGARHFVLGKGCSCRLCCEHCMPQ